MLKSMEKSESEQKAKLFELEKKYWENHALANNILDD